MPTAAALAAASPQGFAGDLARYRALADELAVRRQCGAGQSGAGQSGAGKPGRSGGPRPQAEAEGATVDYFASGGNDATPSLDYPTPGARPGRAVLAIGTILIAGLVVASAATWFPRDGGDVKAAETADAQGIQPEWQLADAGSARSDSGSSDAGPSDAGRADAGRADAGRSDAAGADELASALEAALIASTAQAAALDELRLRLQQAQALSDSYAARLAEEQAHNLILEEALAERLVDPSPPVPSPVSSMAPSPAQASPREEPRQPTAEPRPSAEPAQATAEQLQPTAEPVPPTAKQPRPTAEPVLPTAEQPRPTAEPVPPTAEQPRPMAEPVLPIAEQPRPTAEPVLPIAEQPRPTAEPVPPTAEQPQSLAELPPPPAEQRQSAAPALPPPATVPHPPTTIPPAPLLSAAMLDRLMLRASQLREQGDIAAARAVLESGADSGHGPALFQLAETYDPETLSAWRTLGTKGDVAKARELYLKAEQAGVAEATERLRSLPH